LQDYDEINVVPFFEGVTRTKKRVGYKAKVKVTKPLKIKRYKQVVIIIGIRSAN